MAPGYQQYRCRCYLQTQRQFHHDTTFCKMLVGHFATDKDLQKAGNYGLKNDGDSSLFQFGFLGTATLKSEANGKHYFN